MKQISPAPRWIAITAWLVVASCAAQRPAPVLPPDTGDVSWRMKEPEGTKRYKMAIGEVASGASLNRRITPVYPDDQLALCSHQEVEAQLIVDGAGNVDEVRMAGEASSDANHHSFFTAVRTAALQWKFTPLHVSHWSADVEGNSHMVSSETLPFSYTYVFHFECHAGKTAVTGGTMVTPQRH